MEVRGDEGRCGSFVEQRSLCNLSGEISCAARVLDVAFGGQEGEPEHELELSQLDQHEEQEKKKKKNISLKEKVDKYDSSGDETEKEEMEDVSLLVRKFSKFLKRNKGAKIGQTKRFTKNNEASTSNQNFTCFECGKPGDMKIECPNPKKNPFKGKKEINTR
ncbi:hypothetical protein Lal_00037552 [Lupinus albus]|nr:hypothetical protein Lal_00037552 [Lupinus albus]